MFRIAVSLPLIVLFSTFSAIAEDPVQRGVRSIRTLKQRQEVVHLDLSDVVYPSDCMDRLQTVPKLKTLVVAGPHFTDRQLDEFAQIETLQALVLDSTDVTDEAIAALRKNRPDLIIHRSQRRAIRQIEDLSHEGTVTVRVSESHPELRQLLGNKFFQEATRVNFRRLPDIETGPWDPILNEQLAPLKYLTTITQLDLHWTRINDAGMVYLRGLTNLQRLHLPLAEVSAEGLSNLRHMQQLRTFSASHLADEHMKQIGSLTKLVNLTSFHARLTDAGLEPLADLKELEYLFILDSRIQGPGLRFLADLPHLETLRLDRSPLEELTHIADFPALRYLHISDTKVDDSSLQPLARSKTLHTLWLDDTQVGNEGVAHLQHISTLRALSLSGTRVRDAGIEQLKQQKLLEYLNLGSTDITIESLKHLQQFPNLEQLFLYGLPLDEEGLQLAEQLTQLKKLFVTIPVINSNLEAREAKYARLRRALPNCQVH